MRVLHVGKYFPPVAGGMERFLADLVHAQRARGEEAFALVHQEGPVPADDPPWLTRAPVWAKLLFAPLSPGFPGALAKAIARHRPDALHLHLPNPSAFWALALPSARRLPWIVHWHSDVEVGRAGWPMRLAYGFYRHFERAVLERAACVVASSPPYLASSEPLAPWRDKCVVVPLGLDASRLPDIDPAEGNALWTAQGLRVLAVGRLTYYKGFDTLLRAAAGAKGVQLVVAGGGEERARLERILDEAGRPAHVRLAGAVDEPTLARLMATCDLLALPSIERTEAFGIVLMEAMRYGKPLVASRLEGSGVTWVAREGENAVLAPPGDAQAWRRALEALAADEPVRARLGAAGRRRFEAEFGIDRVAAAMHRAYGIARRAADEEESPGLARRSSRPLVIIPALNEAACIGEVLRDAMARIDADFLVVDDGSTDATPAIARAAGATVIRAPLWQGAWGAIQTGLRYAVRHGYSGAITMDADGQHEPSDLPALLEAARGADVVIAACPSRGSFLRHVAWRYFRLLTGFNIEDLTSGFRYYNAAACELLSGEEATLLDYQDIGVLLLLRHARLRIVEIDVRMNPRRDGASRVFSSWLTVGRYMAETTILCLARWKRTRARP